MLAVSHPAVNFLCTLGIPMLLPQSKCPSFIILLVKFYLFFKDCFKCFLSYGIFLHFSRQRGFVISPLVFVYTSNSPLDSELL